MTQERLLEIISEAYQVVGALAHYTGTFDHPDVQKALDVLAYPEDDHESLLPWPKTPIERDKVT